MFMQQSPYFVLFKQTNDMEFRNLVQLTEYLSDKQVFIDYLTNLR